MWSDNSGGMNLLKFSPFVSLYFTSSEKNVQLAMKLLSNLCDILKQIMHYFSK